MGNEAHASLGAIVGAAALMASTPASATPAQDQMIVAGLDVEYQAAVKRNDVDTMDRILHEEFALVRGDGRVVTRAELLESARLRRCAFEQQDEEAGTQTVRVWNDTAVVTALLWVKGACDGERFDRRVWFSDTYVRTQAGWRYAFAQVSLPLPAASGQ